MTMTRLAFCFLSILCLAGCGGADPRAPILAKANKFVHFLGEEKFSDAYEEMALSYRTGTPFKEFASQANRLKADPAAQVVWKGPSSEADPRVEAEVRRTDGTTARLNLEFAREVADWKISDFRVTD